MGGAFRGFMGCLGVCNTNGRLERVVKMSSCSADRVRCASSDGPRGGSKATAMVIFCGRLAALSGDW